MRLVILLALLCVAPMGTRSPVGSDAFRRALRAAEEALAAGEHARARAEIERALEGDPCSRAAWELAAQCAEAEGDQDARVHALHRVLSLASAGGDRTGIEALRARVRAVDPVADELFALRSDSAPELVALAERYAERDRPHAAIAVLRLALALDPDQVEVRQQIARLASAPDASMAGVSRTGDLLAGVSTEWIAAHDREHATWRTHAKLERPSTVTHTDAGYEVLVRAAEAMERMNASYRSFLGIGERKGVPRLELRIFASRAEYLAEGSKPAEGSLGQWTGSAVETFVGPGGLEELFGTLFREGARPFVGQATKDTGWLAAGLASWFEGARVLADGTLETGLPANPLLFPLALRLERGWMANAGDGIDPAHPERDPPKAPTLRLLLEGEYESGPAWVAPAWGAVYFLHELQDESDGRFVYRRALRELVDAPGGKVGKAAVQAFEKLVLAKPAPPTEGVRSTLAVPADLDALSALWRTWVLRLRDEQAGRARTIHPPAQWRSWAQNALKRGDPEAALELFERGLAAAPLDVDLLLDCALCLEGLGQVDRAGALLQRAARVVASGPVNDARVARLIERRLRRIDPDLRRREDARAALVRRAGEVVRAYLDAGLPRMALEVASALANELREPELLAACEKALAAEGSALARWRAAYDEESLRGWNAAGLEPFFEPAGETLRLQHGDVAASVASGEPAFACLALDRVTSGDFSLEAELSARADEINWAGLVFGRKSAEDFHALLLYPPGPAKDGTVDLATFYANGTHATFRHTPLPAPAEDGAWHRLRIDVTGTVVDAWVDGRLDATHDFEDRAVLRGSFGLIAGRGRASFRDVRFLARDAGVATAPIERKLRLGSAAGGNVSVDGSWIGLVPPFPVVSAWIQEPRASWDEGLGAPQLLVLWSCRQNDVVPIDGWLRALAQLHAPHGLRIVCIADGWEANKVAAYLAEHPLPGSVAVDELRDKQGAGATFEAYDAARFHLPRLLLLDVDGKVAWEGEPGFSKAEPWDGESSLLDGPLGELVAARRLGEYAAWRARWSEARAALASGDLARAAPLLLEAESFDATVLADVAEACARLADVRGALESLEETAAEIVAEEAEPALETLLDWARALDVDVRPGKVCKSAQKSERISEWKRAQSTFRPVLGRLQAGRELDQVDEAIAKASGLGGLFPARLCASAAAAPDAAALRVVLEEAPLLPGRWLADEFFGWR